MHTDVSNSYFVLLFTDLGIQSTEGSMSSAQHIIGNGTEEQTEFDEERAENGCSDNTDDDDGDDDDDKAHLAIRFAPQDKTICKFRDQIY